MPTLSSACSCGGKISGGECDRCGPVRKPSERERQTAYQRGYDRSWQKYATRFKQQHPICAHCQRQGKLSAAEHVDHIIAHKGDQELFWDRANHQGLCASCHSRKTTQEQAGTYDATEDQHQRRKQMHGRRQQQPGGIGGPGF